MGVPGAFGSILMGGLVSAMYVLVSMILLRLFSDFHVPYQGYMARRLSRGVFKGTFRLGFHLLVIQTYIYFMHYSGDASTVKFLVAAIWILDTLHLSCMCHALYYYLVKLLHLLVAIAMSHAQSLQITNYGILTSLEYMVWTFPASLLINVLVIAIVQCSFAHTISCLCRPQKKWLVAGPIVSILADAHGKVIIQ
ncbi:hypothetical protein M404DRAFT_284729 [Pisolithus tinctorius Marx 270]|uniref:Uncharacterized protein n=1 Tax=Pisolithus tinctorius Marx 270 TaxID=870435 RepID=A0A0C3P8C4_PISTI|nr:hypothetical protein M404DRAFT_284729 [Pisolithus tinctorius Marx 270]